MKERQSLYSRAYQLAQEALVNKEDTKELIGEFTYHKEYNTEGFDKTEVKNIVKAAQAKAKQDNLAEKVEELNKLQQIQEAYS